jgi:O-antigen/teichoic acid export membrane protein
MRKRRILINALMSVVQVVITGGALFVLYRFLLDTIGVADFGVWAVVLATTSASGVAKLGFNASTVKFVSMYLARDDEGRIVQIVQTAVLSIGVLLVVVLLIAYPLLLKLLAVIIPAENLPDAYAILPYALVSFWLVSIGSVLQSCIDGHHRIDLRSVVVMTTTLVYLTLAFVLVPRHGLIGLAQAQVLQGAFLVLLSWILLKRLLRPLPLLPYRWNRSTFSEILGYSVNFQVISVAQMLFEPTTKSLLSKFGGVDMAGYFEMANRMVVQLRSLIATAHQSIVPAIADLQETNPSLIQDIYKKSYHLLLYLILPSLPFLLVLTPLISRLWIGAYQPTFVLFATLLFLGWFLNMTANPAYFANMGIGTLRWNVIGHVVIGILNGALGLLLGWQIGGVGVVIGFVVALVTGSVLIAVSYQRTHAIRAGDLVQRESLWLGAASLLALAVTYTLYNSLHASWSFLAMAGLVVGLYLALIGFPLWHHPMRHQIQGWLMSLWRANAPKPASEGS